MDSGLERSTCGGSSSAIFPWSSTRMRSDVRMVSILWAIVIMVESLSLSLITFCSNSSVAKSMLAVASSTSTIFLGFSRVREMLISCFSPALKLWPPYSTSVSSPSLASKLSQMPHVFNTYWMSLSWSSCSGSMLSLTVPLKRKCYCRITLKPALMLWMSRA